MNSEFHSPIPEAQIALFSELAELSQRAGRPLNLGDLQSLVFVAQESLGLRTRYSFEFSSEGPSSADLTADVDLADSVGAISIQYDAQRNHPFVLVPSCRGEEYRAKSAPFIQEARQLLDKISTDFLELASGQVELRAVILFSAKELGPDCISNGPGAIRDTIRELRPRLSPESIDSAILDLQERGYFTTV